VVDSRDDLGLRVEAVRNAVSVVTQLSVQDQLEEGLLDTGEGAVKLVQHQDNRLSACPDEPGWHAEGHDTIFLHTLNIGVTTNITFGHGRTADVDERKLKVLCHLVSQERLTDPCRSAKKNRDLRGKLGSDEIEGFDIHVF